MTSYCHFMSYGFALELFFVFRYGKEKSILILGMKRPYSEHLNGDRGFGEYFLDNSRLCHWFESFRPLKFEFRQNPNICLYVFGVFKFKLDLQMSALTAHLQRCA